VSALAVGDYHACALTDAGTAKCWGSDRVGELGDGSFVTSSVVPVDVKMINDATSLTAGANHACVLRPGGAYWCWGKGNLSDGTTTNRADPAFAATVSGATRLAEGAWHNCALAAGAVRCWGYNGAGQLGNGSFADSFDEPVSVSTITDATAISARGDFSCAIVEAGRVKCWGMGSSGALGNGSTANSPDPVYVQSISDATALAAGVGHACVIVSGGAVKCWGVNNTGQLGNPSVLTGRSGLSTTPVNVPGLTGAISIAAGPYNTCAILIGGTLRCWGDNGYHQLGPAAIVTDLLSTAPLPYLGLAGVDEVGIGWGSICARIGGRVKCWGMNVLGQLGDGTTIDRDSPVDVRF
jgi:alpha-tubulin suppressor-like RCC1 family protein